MNLDKEFFQWACMVRSNHVFQFMLAEGVKSSILHNLLGFIVDKDTIEVESDSKFRIILIIDRC